MLKFLYKNFLHQVERYKQFLIFFDNWNKLKKEEIDIFQVLSSSNNIVLLIFLLAKLSNLTADWWCPIGGEGNWKGEEEI